MPGDIRSVSVATFAGVIIIIITPSLNQQGHHRLVDLTGFDLHCKLSTEVLRLVVNYTGDGCQNDLSVYTHPWIQTLDASVGRRFIMTSDGIVYRMASDLALALQNSSHYWRLKTVAVNKLKQKLFSLSSSSCCCCDIDIALARRDVLGRLVKWTRKRYEVPPWLWRTVSSPM